MKLSNFSIGGLALLFALLTIGLSCSDTDSSDDDNADDDDVASGIDDDDDDDAGDDTDDDETDDSGPEDELDDDDVDDDVDDDDGWVDDDDDINPECQDNHAPQITNVHFEVDGVEAPLPIVGDQETIVTLVADFNDADCNLGDGYLWYQEGGVTTVTRLASDTPCDDADGPLRISFFPFNFQNSGAHHGFLTFKDRCDAPSEPIPFDTTLWWNPLRCFPPHPPVLTSMTVTVNGVEAAQPLIVQWDDDVRFLFAYSDAGCNVRNGSVYFTESSIHRQLARHMPTDMPCECTEDGPYSVPIHINWLQSGSHSGEVAITDSCGDYSNQLPLEVTVNGG